MMSAYSDNMHSPTNHGMAQKDKNQLHQKIRSEE